MGSIEAKQASRLQIVSARINGLENNKNLFDRGWRICVLACGSCARIGESILVWLVFMLRLFDLIVFHVAEVFRTGVTRARQEVT